MKLSCMKTVKCRLPVFKTPRKSKIKTIISFCLCPLPKLLSNDAVDSLHSI